MENLTATLIHTNGGQRFYKLSQPIVKGFYTGGQEQKDILIELEDCKKYLKPEYSTLYDNLTGVDLICVSDAFTHTERLVFAGIQYDGKFARTKVQIDGAHTMMTQGGDSKMVKPDQVYLRRLASINGFYYQQTTA